MNIRKEPLASGEYYHIFSRSIAKYVLFNNAEEYSRIIELIKLFRFSGFPFRYSRFLELEVSTQKQIVETLEKESGELIEVISYCVMPTHIHLTLKQLENEGITKYMSKVLNSYSKYFNIKHNRKGPLWEASFQNVRVETDEQLLHLTRYQHLNPVSAGLIGKPEAWPHSSYKEYLGKVNDHFCNFKDVIGMSPSEYSKFVGDQIADQKQLSIIKNLMIDDYSG